jgi:hypothetical protein
MAYLFLSPIERRETMSRLCQLSLWDSLNGGRGALMKWQISTRVRETVQKPRGAPQRIGAGKGGTKAHKAPAREIR